MEISVKVFFVPFERCAIDVRGFNVAGFTFETFDSRRFPLRRLAWNLLTRLKKCLSSKKSSISTF